MMPFMIPVSSMTPHFVRLTKGSEYLHSFSPNFTNRPTDWCTCTRESTQPNTLRILNDPKKPVEKFRQRVVFPIWSHYQTSSMRCHEECDPPDRCRDSSAASCFDCKNRRLATTGECINKCPTGFYAYQVG